MKEYDRLTWLEDLADKHEVPVDQVMIAYAVYEAMTFPLDTFEQVLDRVFGG